MGKFLGLSYLFKLKFPDSVNVSDILATSVHLVCPLNSSSMLHSVDLHLLGCVTEFPKFHIRRITHTISIVCSPFSWLFLFSTGTLYHHHPRPNAKQRKCLSRLFWPQILIEILTSTAKIAQNSHNENGENGEKVSYICIGALWGHKVSYFANLWWDSLKQRAIYGQYSVTLFRGKFSLSIRLSEKCIPGKRCWDWSHWERVASGRIHSIVPGTSGLNINYNT